MTFGDVLLGNITFFDFCCFRCVTHYVAVNICINCSFFTFIIIIIDNTEAKYCIVNQQSVLYRHGSACDGKCRHKCQLWHWIQEAIYKKYEVNDAKCVRLQASGVIVWGGRVWCGIRDTWRVCVIAVLSTTLSSPMNARQSAEWMGRWATDWLLLLKEMAVFLRADRSHTRV